MFINNSYSVLVEKYVERHFLKSFSNKYKGAWDITWRAVTEELKRIDNLFNTSIAETIIDINDIKIVKTEFRVAGTKLSRKGSGNRCIVAVHKLTKTVHVLLVYNKTDLGHGNETVLWKEIIKANYPQYANLF